MEVDTGAAKTIMSEKALIPQVVAGEEPRYHGCQTPVLLRGTHTGCG